MTVEGYFDGTAVRTVEPLDLKPQQKVFIHIPQETDAEETKEERKKRQLEAIHGLAGLFSEEEKLRKEKQKKAVDELFDLLTEEEAAAFSRAMEEPLRLRAVDLA